MSNDGSSVMQDALNNKAIAAFFAYSSHDVEIYAHANGFAGAVWQMREKLRRLSKYDSELNRMESKEEVVEMIQDYLNGLCQSFHLPED